MASFGVIANFGAKTGTKIAGPLLARSASWFSGVEMGPPDAIFGIKEAFKKDKSPNKIDLGLGAYRTDEGKPYVLPSVRMAEEKIMRKQLDKEYALIEGIPEFRKEAVKLAVGNSDAAVQNGSSVTVQTISGTGALRVGGMYLQKLFPGKKVIYLPNPSWPNHGPVFRNAGLEVKSYKYYDPKTCGVDINGMIEDLKSLPKQSIVLFHACAHNPTGADPSLEQWKEISRAVKDQELFPFFDMAYQGFASGDTDLDAAGLRIFLDDGHQLALSQSFAKNMGLYGERVGAFNLFTGSKAEADAVMSQLKILIRPLYSNPPIYGARIATEILTDQSLRQQWLKEVKGMADRIISMRTALKSKLEQEGSLKDWSHITNQIGMFCYSGLTPDQVEKIKQDHSIYMTKDARIAIVGITTKNVDYLAKAIHDVTKNA